MDPSTLLTVPKPLNDYGLAFQNGPDHATNPDAALAAIEGANSDNDTLGLTNRQEIDNRFFPGDASDPVSLAVNTAGTGSGTVSRSNPGILCGTSFCYANHDPNPAPNDPDPLSVPETVTLTATPASDSSFTGWNGACTGTNPCTVSMTQDLSVTATFISQFTLTVVKAGTGSGTVTSSPAGLSCDNICFATSAAFDQGTSVTLTASTANDSSFTGWSLEGCSGTGTCTVSMIQARTVRATFTLQQFPLTVVKAGTGSGTVTSSPVGLNCGSTCSAPFDQGTSVTLTASAANDSNFTGWSLEGCSGTGTCTVSMTQARNVTATFTPFVPPVIGHPTDFDGDSKADILWRHGSTGQVTVWLMNGPTIVTVATVAQVSDPGWQVVGIADVNGDGKADLLWHHTITGQVTVWLMNGPTIATVATVAQVSDPGWQIARVIDVNGDGKADLVWHHTTTGQVTVWLMNGTQILQAVGVAQVGDLDWQIQ